MTEDKGKLFRSIAVLLMLMVYAGMVLSAGVRSFDLVQLLYPTQFQMVGYVATFLLVLNGIAIPLATHYYLQTDLQRRLGIVLYIVELTTIVLNGWVEAQYVFTGDFNAIPFALQFYVFWIFPVIAVANGGLWAVILSDDPHMQETRLRNKMQGEIRIKALQQGEKFYRTQQVQLPLARLAEQRMLEISAGAFGLTEDEVFTQQEQSEPPITRDELHQLLQEVLSAKPVDQEKMNITVVDHRQ